MKAGKLKNGLATLLETLKKSRGTIQGLESRMALDVKAIAHLKTLVNKNRSNCLCETAESGELQRLLDDMDGKPLEAVSSAEYLQAMVSAMLGDADALTAN